MAIPLRFRVPNPPPVFVGREPQVKALCRLVARGAVTVVGGPEGIGKTSFLSYVLQHYFPDRAQQTVWIDASALGSGARLLKRVTRTLCKSMSQDLVETDNPQDAVEAMVVTCIDLAETGGFWVVVDGVEDMRDPTVIALLDAIAAYARTSRWLFSSRSPCQSEAFQEQVLALPALSARALHELASECGGSLDDTDLKSAIRQAQGSPSQLRRMLALAHAGAKVFAVGKGTHSTRQRKIVETLAVVGEPMSVAVLEQVVGPGAGQDLQALSQEGFIKLSGGFARISEASRPIILTRLACERQRKIKRRIAHALSSHTDPASVLQAICLWLDLHCNASASQVLRTHYRVLAESDLLIRLWTALNRSNSPSLTLWKLRVAIDLGESAYVAKAECPEGLSFDDLFVCAQASALLGSTREAESLSHKALALAPQSPRLEPTFQASVLLIEALLARGCAHEAAAQARSLVPQDDTARSITQALLALTTIRLDSCPVTKTHAQNVASLASAVRGPDRSRLDIQLVHALVRHGYLKLASELADTLFRNRNALAWDTGALGLTSRALIAVNQGDLPNAAQLSALLESRSSSSREMECVRLHIDIQSHLLRGDFERIEAPIARLLHTARSSRSIDDYAEGLIAQTSVAMAVGEPGLDLRWPDGLRAANPQAAAPVALCETRHRIRWASGAIPSDYLSIPTLPSQGRLRILTRLAQAETCLVAGDDAGAWHAATVAAEWAREEGWILHLLEALDLLCVSCVCGGRYDRLPGVIESLEQIGIQVGSRRAETDVRLLRAILHSKSFDPGALECVALAIAHSPTSARRARAILGIPGAVDNIDARFIASVRRQTRVRTIAGDVGDYGSWSEGWGLDMDHQAVWLPRGRWIDLSQYRTLWRALLAIVYADGPLTKESLVKKVWDTSRYDSTQDDTRMRVTIRRLRAMLEDDASRPKRVVTTHDGYGLGVQEPVRVLQRTQGEEPVLAVASGA